jgi:hypothetical protein
LDEHQKANPGFVLQSKAHKYIAPIESQVIPSKKSKVEEFHIQKTSHTGFDNATFQPDSLCEEENKSDISTI